MYHNGALGSALKVLARELNPSGPLTGLLLCPIVSAREKGDAVTMDELQDALRRFGGELATAMSAAADAASTNSPAKLMGALRMAASAADDLVRRL
jgi:hypothetical protein